jgi:hypothetical protein
VRTVDDKHKSALLMASEPHLSNSNNWDECTSTVHGRACAGSQCGIKTLQCCCRGKLLLDMPGACGHSAGSKKRTDAYNDAIAVQQQTALLI